MTASAAPASPEAIRACLSGNPEPMGCLGAVSQACLATRGTETTIDIVECIGVETAAWDALLNEEYQTTMAAFRALDATGDVASPDLTRERTLREAQRAWMTFRDAECRARYARWGMGTLRQVAGANCVMEETAERTIELRDMREP